MTGRSMGPLADEAAFGFDDALDALRWCWGDLYNVEMLGGWSARRLDGADIITACSAAELNLAIREREMIRARAPEDGR